MVITTYRTKDDITIEWNHTQKVVYSIETLLRTFPREHYTSSLDRDKRTLVFSRKRGDGLYEDVVEHLTSWECGVYCKIRGN
jgi:hypothetical protein